MYEETDHTLSGNTILSNGRYGLALDDSTVDAQNDVIAGHTSADAAVYVDGTTLTARHWTLVSNGNHALTATNSSTALLTNTIVASHTLGGPWGPTVVADHTLVFDNGTPCGGGAVCSNNLSGNPQVVDPAAGDYHIAFTTAVRNRGIDAGVVTDIDGERRPYGTGYDIGADPL